MARIKNGILGPIEGSIAMVTGYQRLGVPVLRKKPEPQPKNKPRSTKQLAVNNRLTVAMKFIKQATPFLNVSFSLNRPKGLTAHNLAVSEVVNNGIKGEYPELELNFPNFLVATGDLPLAINPTVEMTDSRTLRFSWELPAKLSYQRGRDQVMLLAYMPEKEIAFYLTSGARRNQQQEVLEVSSGKPGEVFETYIAFISDDRKRISKSIYTGQIVIE